MMVIGQYDLGRPISHKRRFYPFIPYEKCTIGYEYWWDYNGFSRSSIFWFVSEKRTSDDGRLAYWGTNRLQSMDILTNKLLSPINFTTHKKLIDLIDIHYWQPVAANLQLPLFFFFSVFVRLFLLSISPTSSSFSTSSPFSKSQEQQTETSPPSEQNVRLSPQGPPSWPGLSCGSQGTRVSASSSLLTEQTNSDRV